MMGSPSTPALPDMPAMAQPAKQPVGSKPAKRSMAPSFLGAAAVPTAAQSNVGGKTLLGQ